MSIPDYETLMLPLMQLGTDGREDFSPVISISYVVCMVPNVTG
jgi:hypothetical protein